MGVIDLVERMRGLSSVPDASLYAVASELERRGIDPSEQQIEKILDSMLQAYESSKVSPGTNIGVIAAHSIGEPLTQAIMRSFHYAGVNANTDIVSILNENASLAGMKSFTMALALKPEFSSFDSVVSLSNRLMRQRLSEICSIEVVQNDYDEFGEDYDSILEKLSLELDSKEIVFKPLPGVDLYDLYDLLSNSWKQEDPESFRAPFKFPGMWSDNRMEIRDDSEIVCVFGPRWSQRMVVDFADKISELEVCPVPCLTPLQTLTWGSSTRIKKFSLWDEEGKDPEGNMGWWVTKKREEWETILLQDKEEMYWPLISAVGYTFGAKDKSSDTHCCVECGLGWRGVHAAPMKVGQSSYADDASWTARSGGMVFDETRSRLERIIEEFESRMASGGSADLNKLTSFTGEDLQNLVAYSHQDPEVESDYEPTFFHDGLIPFNARDGEYYILLSGIFGNGELAPKPNLPGESMTAYPKRSISGPEIVFDSKARSFGGYYALIDGDERFDFMRTSCNNPLMVFHALGIEAARTVILNNLYATMARDPETLGNDASGRAVFSVAGKDNMVSMKHLMLYADDLCKMEIPLHQQPSRAAITGLTASAGSRSFLQPDGSFKHYRDAVSILAYESTFQQIPNYTLMGVTDPLKHPESRQFVGWVEDYAPMPLPPHNSYKKQGLADLGNEISEINSEIRFLENQLLQKGTELNPNFDEIRNYTKASRVIAHIRKKQFQEIMQDSEMQRISTELREAINRLNYAKSMIDLEPLDYS